MNRGQDQFESQKMQEYYVFGKRAWALLAALMVLGAIAVLAIIPAMPSAEAAAQLPQGYMGTWEAEDGTKVHKFCDRGTAIYVTPATMKTTGVGGAGIATVQKAYACQ